MVTIKTSELHHWRRSGLFIGNFEHISYFFLVFLLLTLNKQMLGESVVTFKYIKETINLLFLLENGSMHLPYVLMSITQWPWNKYPYFWK